MKLRGMDLAAIAATAAEIAAAGYIQFWGKAGPLPMHFGLNGQVNAWGDRHDLAVIVLATAVLTGLLYALLPALSRRSVEQGGDAGRGVEVAQTILLVTFALVCLVATAIGVGLLTHGDGNLVGSGVMGFIGLLMLSMGAWLGKVGPNPFVGVRTYWSLRSRLAWDKSNRLFGRLAFWTGLVGL
ncbi:MAG TPA: SdpI family protein, partial [Caulobacteraceae bacterium]|nr:SdpI family protein [Caulobacteraceae bacterium]